MEICFLNNIQPCWLPAHCSHGLQPLDNAIFAVLKAALDKYAEETSYATGNTPLGKIGFVRCLYEARKAVTPRTIRHGWVITGNYPMSREKALQHAEIQPDKPEVNNIYDPLVPLAATPVDRRFIMGLVDPTDRDARAKAKLVADELDKLRALNAILAKDNAAYKLKEEVKSRTKKRKAVPQPAKKWRSATSLLAKGYTIEQLSEQTGEAFGEAEPEPKRARKSLVVVVEDEEESSSSSSSEDDEEPQLELKRSTRTRASIQKPRRYID